MTHESHESPESKGGAKPATAGEALREQAFAALNQSRFDEAERLFADLVACLPGDPEMWFMRGALCGRRGAYHDALQFCGRAIELKPDYPDALYNLAQVHMHLAQYREASDVYRRLLELRPDDPAVLLNLGYALQQFGANESARQYLERLLSLQPRNAGAFNLLGNALVQSDPAAAEQAYRRAIQLADGLADAHYNLGNLLRRQRRYAQAEQHLQRATEQPGYAAALIGLGVLWQEQGRAGEADRWFRAAVAADPHSIKAASGLLFNLNYHADDPAKCAEEHATLGQIWGRLWRDETRVVSALPAERRDPDRRLRIGYLSADFRQHSVAYFLEPILAGHRRDHFEVYCFADTERPDAVTARLQTLADVWRDITGLAPAAIARLVAEDQIDILIELGGHTAPQHLQAMALRPAPVQMSYLGYPNTTGLEAIDYRIVDAWTDPPGRTEHWHTETLLRLPGGFLVYRPPDDSPAITERTDAGAVTFGSFNYTAKLGDPVIRVWARILHEVPRARLLLKGRAFDDPDQRKRFEARFAAEGVAPDRLELLGWVKGSAAHLAQYARIDVALDTFPYNGTTTTCEALWMGVPVISLAGTSHVGRVGLSILAAVGHPEWAVQDEGAYIRAAVTLAKDCKRLRSLRHTLREQMAKSPLCDGSRLVTGIEHAYRNAWHSSREVASGWE